MMKPHTTGSKTTFSDKNGNSISSVMTNIVDMNTFTAKIVEEREIKKPKLILGTGVGGKHIGMCAATIKQLRLGVHNMIFQL